MPPRWKLLSCSRRQAWGFHREEADRQTDWRRMPCESLVATSDLRVGLKTRDENYTRKHNSEDLPEGMEIRGRSRRILTGQM